MKFQSESVTSICLNSVEYQADKNGLIDLPDSLSEREVMELSAHGLSVVTIEATAKKVK